MPFTRTPEKELAERDEFIAQMYAKIWQPGMPKVFVTPSFPARSAAFRTRLEEMIEDNAALTDALAGFNDIRRDYTQLIRGFNKMIEHLNKFDGGSREPITPESWREVVERDQRENPAPRIGQD